MQKVALTIAAHRKSENSCLSVLSYLFQGKAQRGRTKWLGILQTVGLYSLGNCNCSFSTCFACTHLSDRVSGGKSTGAVICRWHSTWHPVFQSQFCSSTWGLRGIEAWLAYKRLFPVQSPFPHQNVFRDWISNVLSSQVNWSVSLFSGL